MPYVATNVSETRENDYFLGFPRGVNTLQDPTLVNDKNLIQGDNIMIVVDSITRRFGTEKYMMRVVVVRFMVLLDSIKKQMELENGYVYAIIDYSIFPLVYGQMFLLRHIQIPRPHLFNYQIRYLFIMELML